MQLHRAKDRIEEAGFQVVLAGLGSPEEAEEFRKKFDLSFPIVCDPEKKLYSAYGLGRGTLSTMASPSVLLRTIRAMSEGNTPGIPKGDVMQMPGVFMIDTEGRIRYSYYAKDVSDHPSIETLLALKNTLEVNP